MLLLSVVLSSCDDFLKDEEPPVINISGSDAFPKNCVTVYRGESFYFKIELTDNIELGSFSVEMHHNFDHHTHSTSPTQCEMGAVKNALNPLLYIKEFPIPEKLKEYWATGTIFVPANMDTGDYHFMIRVTDASGWQTFEGISVKIGDR
ncbi:MAG: DUF4625 domain-containing protein [Paludibacteraceae bacterium]|nr:DUF4625 domain-containing protein [Paludibacteraceae bacterium]